MENTEIFTEDTIPGACEGHSSLRICDESGLLATEFCPEDATHYLAYMPEHERNAGWKSSSSSYSAPSDYCDIHTGPSTPQNNNNNNEHNNNNQDDR